MATEKHSPADNRIELESSERRRIALDASFEIEGLSNLLVNAAQDAAGEDLWMRGVSIRLRSLSQVIMSALGDELDTVEAMRPRVTGLRAEAEAHHG